MLVLRPARRYARFVFLREERPSRRRRTAVVLTLILQLLVVTSPAVAQDTGREPNRDPRAGAPGRRILAGHELVRLVPTGDLADVARGGLVPSFSLGYADLVVPGLDFNVGLGYWYVTSKEDDTEGGHAFPLYGAITYAPFRGRWMRAALTVHGGGVRTDILKRDGEWTRTGRGLIWLGYAATGIEIAVKPTTFLRIYSGVRWIAFLQPDAFGGYVGIPFGARVRL